MIDLYMPDTEIWTPPRPAIIRAAGDLVPPALAMPFMPGFVGANFAPPVEPADISFIGTAAQTRNASTYTFSDVAMGDEAADRYIVVGMAGFGNHTVDSVTVAGEPATQVVSVVNSNNNARSSLYIIALPSGTTSTIVISLNGAPTNYGIAVWRLTGIADLTPHATASAGGVLAMPIDVSLAVPAGGIAIGYGHTGSSVIVNTWSGIDQEFDSLIESNKQHGGQRGFPWSTTAALSVSASGGTNRTAVAASWAKAA